MACFAVAHIEDARVAVLTHGGQVLRGPFDTLYGQILVVPDPQGATRSLQAVDVRLATRVRSSLAPRPLHLRSVRCPHAGQQMHAERERADVRGDLW
jgi:hypothetical protein